MTNADILAVISEELYQVAPCCVGDDCASRCALYEDESGRALCYDCAPDKTAMTDLGRAYRALEKRFA